MVTRSLNRAAGKVWLVAWKRVMYDFSYKDLVKKMVQSKLLMTNDIASQLLQLLYSEMSLLSRTLGLDRDTFDCFLCAVVQKESIYCFLHPDQKLVSRSYLRDFDLLRREGEVDFFAIVQYIHTQVYCPINSRCKQVR